MIRIAAVSDLHCNLKSRGEIAPRFAGVNQRADILLLPGDLTDNGSLEEAHLLAAELEGVELPMLAVLGNHDYASRKVGELARVLAELGVRVLDGDTAALEIDGDSIGIVGVRGFRGGFGENALSETSEPETELWVNATVREVEKLERGLRSLKTHYRVVMTHYAPILGTILGEHPETYPFYGSSRLCEPIDRLGADLVVHGHSHKGTHTGHTPRGIPVYNVAAKVITEPYIVLELGA